MTEENPIATENLAASRTTPEERMEDLMGVLKDTLISMKNMQKENNDLHKQVLAMPRESWERRNPHEENGSHETVPEHSKSRAKPTRPKIDADMDDIGWTIFNDSWSRYKKLTKIDREEEKCLELREACSADVNKLLYEFFGPSELNSAALTEETLLGYIKSAAVKMIYEVVHRWNFNGLVQAEGESIARFVGRLKAQASLCNFKVQCSCNREVSYAEEMISQRVVAGLSNPEHQSKILSEANDLNTLAKQVERIVSLETTDDAADKIRHPSTASAIKSSQYKKGQRFQSKERSPTSASQLPTTSSDQKPYRRSFNSKKRSRKCQGCGRSSHGINKLMVRTDCPAFGKKCDSCGMNNHFATVCEQRKSRASFARTEDDTSPGESTEDDYSEISDTEDEQSYHFAARLPDFRESRSKKIRL